MTLPTIEQLEAMLANVPPKPWTVAFRSDGSAYCSFGGVMAGAHLQINIGLDWDGRFDKHIATLIELAPTLATQRIADAKRIAELEAALRQAKKYLEHEPEYHDQGMGCGLEDRNITDRYDAMAHGWDQAMERAFSETVAAAVEEINTALEATP